MTVGDMITKIQKYSAVLKEAKYEEAGDGRRPWSIKHIHMNGTTIDVRGTDWAVYGNDETILEVGHTPEQLEAYLKTR